MFKLVTFEETPTRNQVIDAVENHLLEQGCQSGDLTKGRVPHFACLYRGPEDRACAVGIFITEHTPEMEGLGVIDLIDNYSDKIPAWFDTHLDLLNHLQDIHDGPDNTKNGEPFDKDDIKQAMQYLRELALWPDRGPTENSAGSLLGDASDL